MGVCLGILIGILTGTVFSVLVMTAKNTSFKEIQSIIKLIAEFLAIPSFWFGGPWLTTDFLKIVNFNDIFESYVLSLTIIFTPIALIVLIPILIGFAEDVRKRPGGTDA